MESVQSAIARPWIERDVGDFSARSVSATTSLPQPGAFEGESLTGRSSRRMEGWAACACWRRSPPGPWQCSRDDPWVPWVFVAAIEPDHRPWRNRRAASRRDSRPPAACRPCAGSCAPQPSCRCQLGRRSRRCRSRRGETALHLLHLGERRRALGAGEWLHERPGARRCGRRDARSRACSSSTDCRCAPHRNSDRAGSAGPPATGTHSFAVAFGLRERLAVGARHAGASPMPHRCARHFVRAAAARTS